MSDETPAATKPETQEVDYTVANPDTVTKYKDAATIAHKVLAEIEKAAVPGATILSLCIKGDEMLMAETAKVYKGKKISKGIAFPTTVSPNDILTPYTPLSTEASEASIAVADGDVLKIQLGAHIDGIPSIVSNTIVVGEKITSDQADLLLGTHYVTEALLRLLLPPALHPANTEEKPYKPPTANAITALCQKIAASYGCNLMESTTTFQLERNEIEAKKRIVLAPGEGVAKSEGAPEVGDVWGVEVSLTKGSGKAKELPGRRATLFRKTDAKFALKRQSARTTLNEITEKFGAFPFGLRQLADERTAKMGVLECVRGNILRQFEVLGDKDGAITSREYVTAGLTKNGLVKFCAPPAPDVEKLQGLTEHKITDEEILKLLEIPIGTQNKKKKKKTAAKKEGE